MKTGSLVECINNLGWMDNKTGTVVGYGPSFKEICTVDGIDREFIHLLEYPDRVPADPDVFLATAFRELQPPMEINISTLLPEPVYFELTY